GAAGGATDRQNLALVGSQLDEAAGQAAEGQNLLFIDAADREIDVCGNWAPAEVDRGQDLAAVAAERQRLDSVSSDVHGQAGRGNAALERRGVVSARRGAERNRLHFAAAAIG